MIIEPVERIEENYLETRNKVKELTEDQKKEKSAE